jgi:hypothetical protein
MLAVAPGQSRNAVALVEAPLRRIFLTSPHSLAWTLILLGSPTRIVDFQTVQDAFIGNPTLSSGATSRTARRVPIGITNTGTAVGQCSLAHTIPRTRAIQSYCGGDEQKENRKHFFEIYEERSTKEKKTTFNSHSLPKTTNLGGAVGRGRRKTILEAARGNKKKKKKEKTKRLEKNLYILPETPIPDSTDT